MKHIGQTTFKGLSNDVKKIAKKLVKRKLIFF